MQIILSKEESSALNINDKNTIVSIATQDDGSNIIFFDKKEKLSSKVKFLFSGLF